MPSFRVKSVKIYTGPKNLHGYIRGIRDKLEVCLDCYDYYSTCGANNMLANPIVTFLTTDIPQAWVQVNPFFWVTADHQILFFSGCLFPIF